jgi:flavin reductase (DIM6/NTAB) family NADH-FMN oxidoreductase RutF
MTSTSPKRRTDRVSRDDFRRLMSSWPTGVAVVTSAAEAEPVGCTASAIISVSLEPPSLLVSLATGGRTLSAIQACGRLALNLLPAQRLDLADRFSRGEQVTRFAGLAFGWVQDMPVLDEVIAAIVCQTSEFVQVADHVLVVAGPRWWYRSSQRHPLICFDRSYWSL